MKKQRKYITASIEHELRRFKEGHRYIMGLDEVGRGSWAGPVTVGAVVLPLDRNDLMTVLEGVKDSKQMTELQRKTLVVKIKEVALTWGIGSVDAAEIDRLGIILATKLAMKKAYDEAMAKVDFEINYLFLDSMKWEEMQESVPLQENLTRGDQRSLSIAAGSILAKTWRDELMVEIGEELPHYGFGSHKGYGTKDHRIALEKYGVTDFHRKYFAPMKYLLP